MTLRSRIARMEAANAGEDEVPPIWWQICTPEYDGSIVAPCKPKPDWLVRIEHELRQEGIDPTPRNIRRALGQLGAPERAGEPDEQLCLVAQPGPTTTAG